MEAIFKKSFPGLDFFYPITRLFIIALSIIIAILPMSQLAELIVSASIIGSIGLMHGATDHVLFINYRKLNQQSPLPKEFFLVYLGILLGMGLVWFILPLAAVVLFVIFSCYHFGQTQLQYVPVSEANWQKKFVYVFWGLTALLAIVLFNGNETAELLKPFISKQFLLPIIEFRWQIIGFSGVFFVIGMILLKFERRWMYVLLELVELGVILFISNHSSLLLSFALFFGLWHSLRASQVQIDKLALAGKFTVKDFIIKSLPFTLISLFGIAILLLINSQLQIEIHPFMIFLIAVSVLTMPHMFVYEKFYGFHDHHD